MEKFVISENASIGLRLLEEGGYESWLAGGCVRDMVMGKTPHDWDITTSATPQEIIGIFTKKSYKTILTGIEHGTVTVVIGSENLEITTFRSEGSYSDHRRPDSVTFVSSPEEDVKRRDFTMNALLYSPKRGLLDLVGGLEDIKKGVIRTVGEPFERFDEDGLRIMRALRFSSVLGFEIEEGTEAGIFENKGLLREISEERKREEFTKLICGKDAKYVLFKYSSVIEVLIPRIHAMIGFEQNNPHHCYDVWVHTLEALQKISPEPILRLTMFFHDIEKPSCHLIDSDGISHFYTHPEKSAATAEWIMKNLRYSSSITERVCRLIKLHDYRFPPAKQNVLRLLNRIGEADFRLLLKVKRADMLAQSPYFRKEKEEYLDEIERVLDAVIEEGLCFSLKDLAISGRDLIAAGVKPGKEIGRILDEALAAVMDGIVENDREKLLAYLI